MAELPGPVQAQVHGWEQRQRATGSSPATLRTRTAALRSYLKHGGDALAPTGGQVMEWLAGCAAQWTRLTYYGAMRSWCDHLLAAGVLAEDPLLGVRRPRTPRRDPQPISDGDLHLLLQTATGRTRAYVLLGAFAGLRVSEIARMRGEVIDEQAIRVVGKGGTEQYVATHPAVWQLAQQMPRRGWWFDRPSGSGHVAGSAVTAAIGRAMADAGIDASAHKLRHSFATRLLSSGAHIDVVQEAMRHASLASTARYLRVHDDAMFAAIRGLQMPAAA